MLRSAIFIYWNLFALSILKHEEICKFPSKEFYDNQLVTDESVNQRTPQLPSNIWPGKDRVPQVFCHIEGLEDTQTVKTSEGNENSRSNCIEAKEIVSMNWKPLFNNILFYCFKIIK